MSFSLVSACLAPPRVDIGTKPDRVDVSKTGVSPDISQVDRLEESEPLLRQAHCEPN